MEIGKYTRYKRNRTNEREYCANCPTNTGDWFSTSMCDRRTCSACILYGHSTTTMDKVLSLKVEP